MVAATPAVEVEVNRAERRAAVTPRGTDLYRFDQVPVGSVIVGTAASGPYPTPRTLVDRREAPEHSQRTTAYWVSWDIAPRQVYYGDTLVFVRKVGFR